MGSYAVLLGLCGVMMLRNGFGSTKLAYPGCRYSPEGLCVVWIVRPRATVPTQAMVLPGSNRKHSAQLSASLQLSAMMFHPTRVLC